MSSALKCCVTAHLWRACGPLQCAGLETGRGSRRRRPGGDGCRARLRAGSRRPSLRRLATRMAVLMMQAAMEPVLALADHSRMLGRHLSADIDASYLALLDRLQRWQSGQERAEYLDFVFQVEGADAGLGELDVADLPPMSARR